MNPFAAKQLADQRKRLGDEDHGTTVSYHHGCRCEKCSTAMREYNREVRNRPKPKIDLCPNCKEPLPHKGNCRSIFGRSKWQG